MIFCCFCSQRFPQRCYPFTHRIPHLSFADLGAKDRRDNVGAVQGSDASSTRAYLHYESSDFLGTLADIAGLVNPELFVVARQNRQRNSALFEAANVDVVMQRSDIIARTIITAIANGMSRSTSAK